MSVPVADIAALTDTNTTNTSLTEDGTDLILTDSDGNTVTIALADIAAATDTNTTNATFAVVGTDLVITDSDGGTVSVPVADIAALTDTDDRTLSLTGNTPAIVDGNSIDLSGYLDNTDSQTLSITGNDLSIAGGNTVTLPSADGSETIVNGGTDISVTGSGTSGDPYIVNNTFTEVDGSITNELTDLSLSGNTLTLTNPATGGNSVDLSGFVNTDDQQISLSTNTLTLSNGTGADTTADLSGYLDNTDNQTLSITGNDLSITGGNTVTLPTADGSETIVNGGGINVVTGSGTSGDPYVVTGTEVDGSVTNEIQDITSGDGSITVNQTGIDYDLSVNFPTNNDNDATNEYNTGSGITGGNLEITDGGGTESVNLISGDANNNIGVGSDGALYLNVASVSIAETNTSLSFDSGTNQLTYTNELGNNPSIDLSSLDNSGTDSQTLSITGNDLSITGGNTVTLPTANGSETIVNGGGINVVTGSGTSGDPYVVTGTEVDGSVTNELTDLSLSGNTLTLTNPATGGNSVDLSGFVNTDDQQISLNTNTLTLSNGTGADTTADLSGYLDNTDSRTLSITGNDLSIAGGNTVTLPTADGSETIVNGGTDISVTGSGTSGDPYVVNNTFTEVDGSVTNEIQDLSISGNTLSLSDDVTTVDLSGYLDNTDSRTLSITGNDLSIAGGNTVTLPTADGSETIVNGGGINVVTGSGTSGDPYVVTGTEVDGSVTNEIQDLSISGNTLSLSDDATTVDLSGYLDNTDNQNLSITGNDLSIAGGNTVTLPTADGSETIVNGGTDISVTGSGTSGDPYVVNNTFTEVDGSVTNELTDLSLSGNTLTLTNPATGGNSVDLSGFVNTDDQQISLSTNTLTLSNGTGADTTADLSGYLDNTDSQTLSITGNDLSIAGGNTVTLPMADGSETIVNGGGINVVTGSGISGDPYVVTGTEVDGSVTNEIQDLSISGNTLSLSDDATTVDLSGYLDNTDNQTLSITGNDLSIAGGNTVTLPTADGSETIVNGGTDISVTGSGTSGDPYVVNSTFTEVDGSVTNEIQTITSIDGSVTLTQTGDDYDLSVPVADGSETIVNGGGINVVTGSGTSGDPYVVTGTEVDGSVTNEIQDLSISGNTLSLSDDATTVDLSGYLDNTDNQTLSITGNDLSIAGGNTVTLPTADGSETIVNGGTDISVTGSGTSGDPYVVNSTFTEVDGSVTNEIQTITSIDGSVTLTQTGDDYDLSVPVADGSETIVNGGGINVVTGSGTSGDPYVVTGTEVDGSVTNELTDLSLSGNTLTLTNPATGGNSVDLSGFVNTDDQQISLSTNTLTLSNGTGADTTADLSGYLDNTDNQNLSITGNDLSIAGGNTVTLPTADGSETIVNGGTDISVTGSGTSGDPYVVNNTFTEVDGSVTNEIQTITSIDGSVTLTQTGDDYDLSVPVADGSETIVNGGTDISVTGSGTSGDPYVVNNTFTEVDGSITNEIQTITSIDGSVTLTQTGDDYDLSVPVADGSETIVNGGGINVVTGSGTSGDPYVVTGTEVDGSVTNEIQDLSISGNTLSLSDDATTVDLSGYLDNTDSRTLSITGNDLSIAGGNTVTLPTADGSETIVNGGTDISVTGSGTSGDPYVVNNTFTEVDGSVTNEIQDLSISGNTLSLSDDATTVDLSGYLDNTDNQNLSITGNDLSIAGGNTVTLPTADGSETIVNGGGINVVTGSGTSGDPYVVTGTEVDGSVTNEVNTAFSVTNNGVEDVLRITDSNGNLDVALSALGTDDQLASEVDSDTPVDVDGDGVTDDTVEDVIQAIAPITSKAARIFYPPSIAIDASVLINDTTVDLYQEYLDQYGGSAANFTASAGAPGTVPTYGRTELYYYVTYADPAVLNIDLIGADGVMQYDVIGTPPDYNSLINVVFVVK
ncbi:hypothetical protein NYZ99_13465 [Maribacter litopenaei]|uniref:Uncharacterized protein n=1 Tax=Maribacter litopenaei TaxID=2976127 RepID=A0ABY5Y4X9_9FLAO|nr:hypothetical protein [Maribacter litopenaei]UWX54053.1 hypothetical protein NYZ99_13465 [Maribacter litopenaei]